MDVERAYAPWVDSRKPEFAWLHDRDPPELKGFSFKLSYGVPVGKSFPGDVVFDLSPSGGVFLADSVPNTSSLYVVSERLRALLEKASDRFEFHRVRIRNHKGRIEKAPYFIANLLDIVDCMDKQRSDYVVDPMTRPRR